MYATQLFIDRSGVPYAYANRKSTLFKLIVKIFLKGVVFMFWHDIVYIELLYCVTNFELVCTWNKVAAVENAKSVSTVPHLPYTMNRKRTSWGDKSLTLEVLIVNLGAQPACFRFCWTVPQLFLITWYSGIDVFSSYQQSNVVKYVKRY